MTFHASVEGLSMFLVALTVSMLVYSSALYYAEVESLTTRRHHVTTRRHHVTTRRGSHYYAEVSVPDSQIESIPDAFWWAIITMTTIDQPSSSSKNKSCRNSTYTHRAKCVKLVQIKQ